MTELPERLKLKIDIPKTGIAIQGAPYGMKAWKNQKNGYAVVACHFSADEEKNNLEWFNAETKNLREDQVKQEYLIDFTSRAGQKAFPFLEMDPKRWTRETRYPIPTNHTIIAGLDFGGTNPTSINFYSVDERGRFHSFWEFYKPSNPGEIARVLKGHPMWPRVLKVVADPSIFNKNQHHKDHHEVVKSIGEMLEDLGIYNLERGVNDRVAGLQRVKHMLRYSEYSPNLEPWLTFSPECKNQFKELIGLVYLDQSQEQLLNKNPEEDVVKKNDHAYDQLRYALMSWKVPAEFISQRTDDQFSLKVIEEEIDERYRLEQD